MGQDALVTALRRLRVETGSLPCLGCGYDHHCSTKGCAILREAERRIIRQAALIRRLQVERKKYGRRSDNGANDLYGQQGQLGAERR